MRNIPQFLIAAPASGTGKTTVSRGLMAVLSRKGYQVQPFKCGPDYIDTKFHERVCHRPSYNLDSFMASGTHLSEIYFQHAQNADVCVVEGMMGLFDGYYRDKGSCSEIAKILRLPVILVVNAQSAAYSLAALISGFLHFKYDVKIAGVIFNNVGSQKHEQMLWDVCEDLHVPCFGYIPKRPQLAQQSRYLGLDFSEMNDDDALADLIEKHVNWEGILQATQKEMPFCEVARQPIEKEKKIWVARNDDSFSFIYAEHIDILHNMGQVTFFNPEEDQEIPDDIDLLSPNLLKPMLKLKATLNDDARLTLPEVLTALSICTVTNPMIKKAIECLDKLQGAEAHSTYIMENGDRKTLKELKINLTCESEFLQDNDYIS